MNLHDALERIQRSLSQMNQSYGRTVFDEVAVVGLEGNQLDLRHYQGPREAAFMREFADDSKALRKELKAEDHSEPGCFSFTREGDGVGFDAYICLGRDLFLFCNHTGMSMKEISEDPSWLDTQGTFLNLSQVFAVNPVET